MARRDRSPLGTRLGDVVLCMCLFLFPEPVGLALDNVARMVYWTDEVGHIARIPMDGSGTKEVIVEDISCPSGIIVHRESG